MPRRQSYIQFGSSAPIVLAPYETIPIGGSPTIQVMDPDLYIRVRDILLARQLSRPDEGDTGNPIGWVAPGVESSSEGTDSEQSHALPVTQVEGTELRKYVDQMLDALRDNDLLEASHVVIEVMGYLGGDPDELRQLVGIFRKILGNYLGKSQENEETTNE